MMYSVKANIQDVIGDTPLIRLNNLSEKTGCEILGKAEFTNPGGSVKDRAALGIVTEALTSGKLKPGGLIVEGTAGNTGISLTLLANAIGCKSLVVMPETQSQEKKRLLKILGAELQLVPAAPYKDPNNYVRYSQTLTNDLRRADKFSSVLWANQFDNTANSKAHFDTTGPELWHQTDGRITAFICSIGSGGTIAGVSNYLKKMNKNIQVGLADPQGSSMFNFFEHNQMQSEGSSITEGIGQGRITKNLEGFKPDHCFKISDKDSLPELYDLLRQEGLYLGGSSAVNVRGAFLLAKKLGPGHTICTILCDSGQRYESKIWNKDFLLNKGLPTPRWL